MRFALFATGHVRNILSSFSSYCFLSPAVPLEKSLRQLRRQQQLNILKRRAVLICCPLCLVSCLVNRQVLVIWETANKRMGRPRPAGA